MAKLAILYMITFFGGVVGALIVDGTYGIYLYELDYFINPRIRWWFGGLPDLRYSFIIAISILVGYLVRYKKYSENRVFDVPQTKWLLSFVILIGLVSFIAVWPYKHNKTFTGFVKLMAFVFLVYKMVDTPQKFERIIWFFLIGSFYLGWVAHTSGRTGFGRLEDIGPMDANSSNGVASVLICPVPILIFYIIEGTKNWQKFISAIILAFIFDGIILVNSRGSFLGLITSLLYFSYFVFFKRIKGFKFKVKMGVGLVFGIVLFVYLTDAIFWERMHTLKDIEVQDEGGLAGGGASRTHFWITGIKMVKDYPFGAGSWGYVYLSSQYLEKEHLARDAGLRAAHSTWVDALVEYGYLGFVIFLCYVISNFNLNRKVRRHLLKKKEHYLYYQNIAISSAFVGYLVTSSFIDRINAEMMYWIPTFMACFANIYMIKDYTFNEELSEVGTGSSEA